MPDPSYLNRSNIGRAGYSQLRQHSLSTRNRDLTTRLLLRIYDLAVIDDDCVACCALAQCPAEFLGEVRLRIRKEKL